MSYVIFEFKVLLKHSPGGTVGSHKNLKTLQLVTQAIMEMNNCQIQA